MKKVTRNDLWMMIIAWCLLLNGYSILGIIVCFVSSIYLIANIKIINKLRVFTSFLAFTLLNGFLSYLTTAYLFNFFPFFCVLVSINLALLNERLKKERLLTLEIIFAFMIISLIVFMFTTYLLPNSVIFEAARQNMYSLIVLIFIPYTSEILVSLIIKIRNKYKFVNKQKSVVHNKIYYN